MKMSNENKIELESRAKRSRPRLNAVLFTMVVVPLLYFISIGIMTPLLRYHGGHAGYRAWQIIYGDPLGHAPSHVRGVVNRYLAFSDRTYWLIRERVTRP
ncbi:MAG: hypothetical protein KDA38_00920 [Planctomycetales bacterium]|nr:hypothetical protein [Planctomycetales bacterium]